MNLSSAALLISWGCIGCAAASPDPGASSDRVTVHHLDPARHYAYAVPHTARDAGRLAPVNLVIALQKTAAPRTTDTWETARKDHMASIAAMVRLRESEDTNFANRARMLASRMTRTQRFGPTPGLGRAQTGEEFLAILIDASRRGPISNLVVYGHSGPTGLYMREDRGFYASLPEIAKASPLVSGSGPEREDALRGLGARDLADLRQLIADRHVRFTHDAVIVFTGCSAAGESAVERSGFAARTAETARATVFASVGVTDQSMAGRTSALPVREYSRGMWVRFAPVAPPTRLGSRVLDVLRQLNRDEVSVISAGELAPLPAHSEVPRLHCSCTFPVQTGAVI